MHNKEQEKDISNLEFDKDKLPNNYKTLLKKLRSMREIINLLEKNFIDKEI